MSTKIFRAALLVMAALVIIIFGGMSRTYSAFGGEDVLALFMIGFAVRELVRRADNGR